MKGRTIRPCGILLSGVWTIPFSLHRVSDVRRWPGHLLPTMRHVTLGLLIASFGAVSACRGPAATAPTPATAPVKGAIPPVPLVEGPLEPKLVYPKPDQLIQSKDSTFVLGSVGNGRASLAINGQPVRVWPNGSFLAFLPNPAPTDTPRYELV